VNVNVNANEAWRTRDITRFGHLTGWRKEAIITLTSQIKPKLGAYGLIRLRVIFMDKCLTYSFFLELD